jgi:hypothetical protein
LTTAPTVNWLPSGFMAAAASTAAAGGCSAKRTVTDSSSRVKFTGCVAGVERQPWGTSSATSALAAPFE